MRTARRWLRSGVAKTLKVNGNLQLWWTPELPIIYVSNPKAGCSTIKNSLKQAQADDYVRSGRNTFRRRAEPHLSDDCLRNDGLRSQTCKARLLISCVRNPYTRALSGYLDMVRGNNAVQYPELRKGCPASFIEHLETLSVMRPEMMNSHFRPQHINLDVPNITYDATFFLENIGALPQVLRSQLGGFDLKTFAPHARGASAEMDGQYSARAVDLVQRVYGPDFELFGYSRDLADSAKAPGAYLALGILVGDDADAIPLGPSGAADALKPELRYRRLVEMKLI